MLATLLFLAWTGLAAATTLFVADYAGNITSLSLTEKNGKYCLSETHRSTGCAPNPSWLVLDPSHGVLYCLNEGLNDTNGTLNSFTINKDSSLTLVKEAKTLKGPVSGIIYGNPSVQRALAIAHYDAHAVSSWTLQAKGKFAFNQDITFTLDKPGPDPDRQSAPYEHEAILDPTGQYVVVPDLGADLVRVFSWNDTSLKLKPLNPLKVKAGSGPRHAVFYNPYGVACEGCTTYLYIVTELGGTVVGYAVDYLADHGGLSFKQVYESSTYGTLRPKPATIAPAEVHITPDNRYLILSNRGDNAFRLRQPNGSTLISDSLTTFALRPNGTLVSHQLSPAGGSFPRQFSINAIGDLVAVGLQYSQSVVIMARDVRTGLIGEPVARVSIAGNVTNVMWDE